MKNFINRMLSFYNGASLFFPSEHCFSLSPSLIARKNILNAPVVRILAITYICLGIGLCTYGQSAGELSETELYQKGSSLISDRKYREALTLLQDKESLMQKNDSLLYLKIKTLNYLSDTSGTYTRQLDASLAQFRNQVNRFSFPDVFYEEIMQINSQVQVFKEADQQFYDSVKAVTVASDVTSLTLSGQNISSYLNKHPNSFYRPELEEMLAQRDVQRNKIIADSLNYRAMKKDGKKTILTVGYSVPIGQSKAVFNGFSSKDDALNFFQGKYKGSIGIKYSLNASLVDINIGLYTHTKFKFAIDWHLIDFEYTMLEWNNDQVLTWEAGQSKQFPLMKLGTRIGPEFSVLLNRDISVSAYYNVRPGVQVLFSKDGLYYENPANPDDYFEINTLVYKNPKLSLSHEVGIKVRFWRRLYINPFYHFGKFKWQNEIYTSGAPDQVYTAEYDFSCAGIRIGL